MVGSNGVVVGLRGNILVSKVNYMKLACTQTNALSKGEGGWRDASGFHCVVHVS